MQVLAGCPHEAPVISSSQPGSRTIFARVLSCPSMLAAQPACHAGADTSSAPKRPYEYMSSSEDAAPPSPATTENDSGNSAATAEDVACAYMDTSPFAAFCKLSGYAALIHHEFPKPAADAYHNEHPPQCYEQT